MKRGVFFFLVALVILFATIIFGAEGITNKNTSAYSSEMVKSTNSPLTSIPDSMNERWRNLSLFEEGLRLAPLWRAIDFKTTNPMRGEAEDMVKFNLWPSLRKASSGPLLVSEYPISSTFPKNESRLIGWHISFPLR